MCKMIKNKMNYAFLYLFIYFATYFLCFRMHWCLCSLLCIGLFLTMSKLCYSQTSMIDQIDHSNKSHILYITASLPYCRHFSANICFQCIALFIMLDDFIYCSYLICIIFVFLGYLILVTYHLNLLPLTLTTHDLGVRCL